MAKRTANLLRMLLLLQQSRTDPLKTHVPSRLIAPHITKLPLPEDYALQELRQLTRAHMIEMTSWPLDWLILWTCLFLPREEADREGLSPCDIMNDIADSVRM